MPKKYILIWSDTAENDLTSIIEYIAEENVDRAFNILSSIRKKVDNLYKFPSRGRIVPELMIHNINLFREIIIYPWRTIYRIEENMVYVLSIFDGRRNVEDLLLKRLLKT